jgi:hypothetical protein
MLQISVCDDNIDELSNIVQLINQYRASKHLNCEYATFKYGFDLASIVEFYSVKVINCVLRPISKEKLLSSLTILGWVKAEKLEEE